MKYLLFLLLALIGMAFWSCKNTRQLDEPRRDATDLGFEVLKEGQTSGVNTEKRSLIQSSEDWQSTWDEIHANMRPQPPCPEIDFDEKMVLVCFMGDRNSGGYRVEVERLAFEEGRLEAELTYQRPGRNCMVVEMITQPFVVVALNRLDVVEASFEVKEVTNKCEEENDMGADASGKVEWAPLESGNYCGISAEQNVLIKSEAKWLSFWRDVTSNVIPAPDPPQVDFSKKAVIACFMGDRSNGGYGVKITDMVKTGDELKVSVTHTQPGSNCVVTMAITQPYEMVTVDLPLPARVTFDRVEKVVNCDR